MPRYIVERTFPNGLKIPVNEQGAAAVAQVVRNNADQGVTWVHSYVTADLRRSYCVYDGPDPETIVKVAVTNGLPVDRITPVTVLDPYFYLDR